MPVHLPTSAAPCTVRFQGRIGREPGSGFTAVPHRYHLYVSLACPRSLRAAVTRSLAGLEDKVTLSVVTPVRDGRGWAFRTGEGPDSVGGFAQLREAYEATEHHYEGPVSVPVLWDRWSGRIVSNQADDIMYDLATAFEGAGPELYPAGLADGIARYGALFDDDVWEAAQQAGRARRGDRYDEATGTVFNALGLLEHRLSQSPFLFGDRLTAADVHLWTTLLHVDAVHRRHLWVEDVRRIGEHTVLWAYFERLYELPAFRDNLRLDHIAQHHRASCRGPAASGSTLPIVDWDRLAGTAPEAAAGDCG
ncbi:glutathione S-transferase C-terminal domain-containing protein [Yinghuangia seranimata]|uniref:glutathione S-transferase C-terminal domain-containing protein n=1 Tax=Yinghuangia seranimata TaxID=408067 RepID=UPI00248D18BB|nr:glutathione S-transferase C-terminal domain-containing protein [Yinghuangia seranimata]MDI2132028.1 glutathione S-transferase C-terminal domain-containing protein [Yinghuangia seranimata]